MVGGNQAAMQDQAAQGAQDSSTKLPWVLIGLVALYAVYAVLLQHEKIKGAIQPGNVAANVHNFIVVGLSATIFILAMKTLWTKMTAWGFPGAATVAKLFMAT
jgi:uncharacterized membrane protein YuzA (DUF378 family)